MAVIIRLRRMGGNSRPFFRIVATDSRRPNEGLYIENLGWYDPRQKGLNFRINLDRVAYWEDHGARLSDTMRSIVRKAKKAGPEALLKKEPAAPAALAVEAAPAEADLAEAAPAAPPEQEPEA